MTTQRSLETRDCRWCTKNIGVKARVCPYCLRGQGIWIVTTAVPTWVTAVVAVAAATFAVVSVQKAFEAVADARAEREQAVSVTTAPPTRVTNTSDDDMGDQMGEEIKRLIAEAREVEASRLDEMESQLNDGLQSLAAAEAEVTAARSASEATRASLIALQETFDRHRDTQAIREVDARVEHVVERYFDALTECQDESTTCDALRAEVIARYGSLTETVESYREQVTGLSHGIMARNTCAQGRLLLKWSDFGAHDEFAWHRANCT